MIVQLTAEQERLIEQQIASGKYPDPESLVREAIGRLLAEELEAADTREAVEEGLAQAARGEGRPAREMFAEFRAKHDIPS